MAFTVVFLMIVTVFWDVVLCIEVDKQAIPLQAWTGSERSRRLRRPDFKTLST